MSKIRLALLCVAPLLYSGLAMAQTPASAPQHSEMHHHGDMHKSMCEDKPAMIAAHLAYVEVKLNLTDAQKPLFAKFRQATLDAATAEKTACMANAPKGDMRPTVLDREAHAEAMLSAKLQMLQSTRPALQAFYDSLTQAQKDSFNQMGHHHHWGHHGGMGERGPSAMPHPQ